MMVARRPVSVQKRVVLALAAALSLFGCQLIAGDFEIEKVQNSPQGFCEDDEFRCNLEYLLSCNSDHTDFELFDTCPTSELCDSTLGACRVCTEGDQRCDGALRQECNEDGTAWDLVMECPSPAMCNPTFCGSCTAGEYACRGMDDTVDKELWQCGPDNTWSIKLDTCVSAGVCAVSLDMARTDPNWSGKCVDTPCDTAGQVTCEGPELRRCRTDLSGFDVVDTCASVALCEQAVENATTTYGFIERCPIGCLTAGSYVCEDQFLLRCRDDLTGYDPAPERCPEGTDCNPMQGACGPPCTSGEYQCNGEELRRCRDDGTWEEIDRCASSVLCLITEFETTPEGGSRGIAGMCQPPTCPVAGEYMCTEAALFKCRPDLTNWDTAGSCLSPALCVAADGRCHDPICAPGELKCFGNELRRCSPGLTDWDWVITCGEGEICSNDPDDDTGCDLNCPLEPRCNGVELERCTPDGWVHAATCPTTELCTCMFEPEGSPDACQLGTTDGCGTPVCGGTQAGYQCTGGMLQRCEPGRNGWEDVQDCGSAALCYPGASPMFQMGYCATCPTAGEVRCNTVTSGTTTTTRTETCSTDRKTWNPGSNCSALGCIEGGQMDYCAICGPGQTQCSGATLQRCGTDQRSWVSTACASSALCDAPNNQCDVCTNRGLYSCTGQTLHYCTPDGQQDQTQNCPNRCDATGGECDSCNPGTSRCMNTTLYTCNPDGQTETSTTCVTSALCIATANRCDPPVCNVGQTRCNGTQPEICNSGRNGWVATGSPCVTAALCNASNGTCSTPACSPNQRRCMGDQPQVCNTDRTDYVNSGSRCASVPLCNLTTGQCDMPVCVAGATRCSGAQPQVCRADRTGWDPMGPLCASSALCVAATGTCTTPTCMPNQTRCMGAQPQICNADLTNWQNVGTMACATPALCLPMSATCQTPTCGVGQERCNNGQPEICNTDRTAWVTDGPACATVALCNTATGNCNTPACNVGDTRCMGSQPQICNDDRTAYRNNGSACATAALCNAANGTCNPEACGAGARRCNGAQPEVCNADQTMWITMGMAACATPALCNNSTGMCIAPTCGVGQRRCDGDQPQICNTDRTDWVDSGDPCVTEELCGFMTTGLCSPPVCNVGDRMCMGAQPLLCNAGRTAYTPTGSPCASPALCQMGGGVCQDPFCMSMQRRCVGTSLQQCNTDLTNFVEIDECATPELCTAGLPGSTCMAPACTAGAWRCSGPNLQQCPTSRTAWITQDMCDSADLCDDVGMECDECIPPLIECVDTVRRECTDTGHWMQMDCAPDPGVCNPQTLMCEAPPMGP